MATPDDILNALRTVQVPDLGADLVTLGMVQDLKAMHGIVTFTVVVNAGATQLQGQMDAPIKAAVKGLEGVSDVAIHWLVKPAPRPAAAPPAGKGPSPESPRSRSRKCSAPRPSFRRTPPRCSNGAPAAVPFRSRDS